MTEDNPLAALIAEVAVEEATDEAAVVDLLEPYRDNQDAANRYNKEAADLGVRIKTWLLMHPDQELVDGERGLVGRLQPRRLPGKRYDVTAIIQNNPRLWEQLIAHGCVELNEKAIKVAGPNVGGVEKYAFPQEVTSALIVERK